MCDAEPKGQVSSYGKLIPVREEKNIRLEQELELMSLVEISDPGTPIVEVEEDQRHRSQDNIRSW